MSIFNPPPIQFSSPAQKYPTQTRAEKNISRRKERKSNRNEMRASKRESAGEYNKSPKINMATAPTYDSSSLIENEISPQRIPSEHDWHRRMNEISPNE